MQGNKKRKDTVPEPIYNLLCEKWCYYNEIKKCLRENNLHYTKGSLFRLLDNTMLFAVDDSTHRERYKLITDSDLR